VLSTWSRPWVITPRPATCPKSRSQAIVQGTTNGRIPRDQQPIGSPSGIGRFQPAAPSGAILRLQKPPFTRDATFKRVLGAAITLYRVGQTKTAVLQKKLWQFAEQAYANDRVRDLYPSPLWTWGALVCTRSHQAANACGAAKRAWLRQQ